MTKLQVMRRFQRVATVLSNLCALSRGLSVYRTVSASFVGSSLFMSSSHAEGQIPSESRPMQMSQVSAAGSHSEFVPGNDADDDGFSEDTIPTWKDRIGKAITKSRKVRGGNYVQIATVDEMGFPRCRTVVFRGFLVVPLTTGATATEALKFITDARSEKISQISTNPRCEMVWWFSQSSEQFRVSGELMPVSATSLQEGLLKARLDQWKNLSDSAREQFYWNSPGNAFSGSPTVPVGGRSLEGQILDPPDSFVLLLLVPKAVKYLRLKDNLAIVDTLAAGSATWVVEKVNP